MFVKYKINVNTIPRGATATTINIPMTMQHQMVDMSDVVKRKFVDVEVERAINPIIDYEKVRFIPTTNAGKHIRKVNYHVNMLNGTTMVNPTTYGTLGLENEDIKFRKNFFKNTVLLLRLYDSDNALVQNFISDLSVFARLTSDDLIPFGGAGVAGQPKPANQIPVRFSLTNPLMVFDGFSEGYHLYDYKSKYLIGQQKELFMRASLFNAKTGKEINLMTESKPYSIDILAKKLYTKYILKRDSSGFYYELDSTYSKNVVFTNINGETDVNITLYQIQTL